MDEPPKNNTITVPPLDLLKIMILRRRQNILNEVEEYYFHIERGHPRETYRLASLIKTFYLEMKVMMQKNMKVDVFKQTTKDCLSKDILSKIRGFEAIDLFLYDKQLTKFDMKIDYDSTDWEAENSIKGLP